MWYLLWFVGILLMCSLSTLQFDTWGIRRRRRLFHE